MMASFMSYFGARRDPKQSAREAIVTLRQQLQMIEKKEEHLQKKIDEELKKAKANAVSNKSGTLVTAIPVVSVELNSKMIMVVATAALKRKKASEAELDRLAGTRLQLEMQVNTLESANLNAETMAAMKKASDALKVIHGKLSVLLDFMLQNKLTSMPVQWTRWMQRWRLSTSNENWQTRSQKRYPLLWLQICLMM
jgi:charged multivesicular body protein 4